VIDALIVLGAFLLGSIPFGVVVSRLFFRVDIRTQGSGNIGAANALRTLG
jgi:glycerol-3-phosphate acyltransferase PlsY